MKQEEEYLGRMEQLIWIIHPVVFPVLFVEIQTRLFKISCIPVQSLSENFTFQHPLKHVKLFQCSFSSKRKWKENGGNTINTSLLHSFSHQNRINSITHCPTFLLGTAQQVHMNSQADSPHFTSVQTFPSRTINQWHLSPLSIFSSTSFSPLPVSSSHYLPHTACPAFHGISFCASSLQEKGGTGEKRMFCCSHCTYSCCITFMSQLMPLKTLNILVCFAFSL